MKKVFLSFLIAFLSASTFASIRYFRLGDVFYWDTGISNGTMKIVSLNESGFAFEQKNYTNAAAGSVFMEGEYLRNGGFRIYNRRWKEVWEGYLDDNNCIYGKVNNSIAFVISNVSGVRVRTYNRHINAPTGCNVKNHHDSNILDDLIRSIFDLPKREQPKPKPDMHKPNFQPKPQSKQTYQAKPQPKPSHQQKSNTIKYQQKPSNAKQHLVDNQNPKQH